ncbi:hypothetical protein [Aeromonas hydrophila]|uniref:hypothetical protein n=1 Tax=Aeromonas hydrophila TaxID=644 RepID=UPI002B485B0E|nr:hypothetical protein [Aeromonas hydrophila]
MDLSGIFNKDSEHVNHMAVQYGYHYYDSTEDAFDSALKINEDIALGVCVKADLSPEQRFIFATILLANHSAKVDQVATILANESQILKCEGIGQALAEFAIYLTLNKRLYEETSLSINGICGTISSKAWLPENYQMSLFSHLSNMLENPSFSKRNFDTIFRLTLSQYSSDFMKAINENSSILCSKHLPDDLLNIALEQAPKIDGGGTLILNDSSRFPNSHVVSLITNPKLSEKSIAMFFEVSTEKEWGFNKGWLGNIYTHPKLPKALESKYGADWLDKIKHIYQAWNNQALSYSDLPSIFRDLSSDSDKEKFFYSFKRRVNSKVNNNIISTSEYMDVIKNITDKDMLRGWSFYDAFELRAQDIMALADPNITLSKEHQEMLVAKLAMSCTQQPLDGLEYLHSDGFIRINISEAYRVLLNSGVDLSKQNEFLTIKGKAQSAESFIDSVAKDEDIEALTAVKLNHKASSLTGTVIQKTRPSL